MPGCRSGTTSRNLLISLLISDWSEATNMGLTEMAASAGVSYDALAWTAEWYFRSSTHARWATWSTAPNARSRGVGRSSTTSPG